MAGRTELGEFLRSCRANVTPERVGLDDAVPSGRRVRGLRREEVAHLAGVSVDYYTRLEQGRHASPSPAVVDALARALQLDAAAHLHLADLARPGRGRPEQQQAQRVRPAVHQMLDSLVDHPAFLIGRRTDVLAANPLARALIADWDALPARHRNYTRWLLLDPAARETYQDWAAVAADAVGSLRLDAGRHPDDPLLERLVGELSIKSAEFRGWWQDRRVHERTHGTKRMRHPAIGSVVIHYEALALPGDPDQTMFVYSTEPGSASHDGMRLLASWTAQQRARTGRVPPGGDDRVVPPGARGPAA
ncbi:helix-turn-helix domain-containing protein [Modestobacter sp. VKM Ac-2985]|uniref:helix-turn-helix domain-containing protein n=1 Tax=Modestobacter sp. VKM Ac-2985 TaxID=3004139 RepID=UPI0022ABC042|nr:helix-turn-helix transcriptional regulator [Modestobacter sp. VKM Ac-2985]MCZ2837551.1 helix-turn-helix transcriptional regulator [Modestobacter sp. VKM Ac-2985]